MFTKQEAQALRQQFWTAFGQYMKPIPSQWMEHPHWTNYKTGIHQLFFHMETADKEASLSIEFAQQDPLLRQACLEHFRAQQTYFTQHMGEAWKVHEHYEAAGGRAMAAVRQTAPGLHVLRQEDWPALISFFKPRILLLDEWWALAKDGFEQAIMAQALRP